MKNTNFWDKCECGTIRNDVAEFIDKNPLLSKYEGDDYYALEDALVNFIFEKREMIFREQDREYHRIDILNEIWEYFSHDEGAAGDIIASSIPFEIVNKIAEEWQETLSDCDSYWDIVWDCLDSTIDRILGLSWYENALSDEDGWLYGAYLKEWFKTHDYKTESPACIKEFFDNEMKDDELSAYYTKLAKKYKDSLKKEI